MAWNGKLKNLPMTTLPADTPLHHGTDCAGDFEVPDGPAWFCTEAKDAAEWAGWNLPPYDRGDGPRRTHAFRTTADVRVIDIDAIYELDDAWLRLCEAATGLEDEELTRAELAEALVPHGILGWWGDGEVMLVAPAGVMEFLGRTPVPGENGLRPEPNRYVPDAAVA